jgi:hypothetical protein
MHRSFIAGAALALTACSEGPAGDLSSMAPGDGGREPPDVADLGRGRDASRPDLGSDAGDGCVPEPRPSEGTPALDLGLSCFVVRPGGSLDFDLGWARCCYFIDPWEGCASWSIEGPGLDVSVDAEGTVSVGPDVAPGTVFTVVARPGDGGGGEARARVTVITDRTHPLQGTYTERARIACADGARFEPREPVREFGVCGDRFDVTYIPFEIRQDFWGALEYFPESGRLELVYEGGNRSAEGLDLEGFVRTASTATLELRDMRLHPGTDGEPRACGHIFEAR